MGIGLESDGNRGGPRRAVRSASKPGLIRYECLAAHCNFQLGTPVYRTAQQTARLTSARLAQSVERKALNLVVVGSSPTVGVL